MDTIPIVSILIEKYGLPGAVLGVILWIAVQWIKSRKRSSFDLASGEVVFQGSNDTELSGRFEFEKGKDGKYHLILVLENSEGEVIEMEIGEEKDTTYHMSQNSLILTGDDFHKMKEGSRLILKKTDQGPKPYVITKISEKTGN